VKARTSFATAAILLLVAVCGSNADSSEPAGAPTPTTSKPAGAAYDGPTIPAGIYVKTFTERDVERLGVGAVYGDRFAPDGTAVVVYKFGDGFWSESNGPTEDSVEPGSDGSHSYDDEGNLVLDEPCCGETVLTWSLDGDALTMVAVGPEGALADPMTHLMRAGTYTRAD
jgi:hypothetical protein